MALMRGSPVLTDDRFGQPRGGYGYEPPTPQHTMTVQGSITATAVLMTLLVVSAGVGWSLVDTGPTINKFTGLIETAKAPSLPPIAFVAVVVGLGFGIVTWLKPKWARATAPLYALATGIWVGAISGVYNYYQNGIVTQALFATIAIFTAMLFLYATRIIKVTNKFVMVVAACTMGIFLMYMLAMVVSLFGGEVRFLHQPSVLGIGISVFIIVIAALNLAIDFAFIEKGALHGAPKYLEWYAAFGVMVTLVWIYLEVLRLLSMLNRR